MKRWCFVFLCLFLLPAALQASWDPTAPADDRDWDLADDDIRANFAALGTLLNISAGATDVNLVAVENVMAYGATGDGETDDAANIQKAIDAVETAGGGIVWFPSGTYVLGAALTVTGDDITLIGVSHDTILQSDDSTEINIIEGADISDFTVMNMTLDGNASGTSDAGGDNTQNGIRIINDAAAESNILIHNVVAEDLYGHGFRIEGSEDYATTNVRIIGCNMDTIDDRGVRTKFCGRVRVGGCNINDSRGAVFLDMCHDSISVVDCNIVNVGDLQAGVMIRGYGPTSTGSGTSTIMGCNDVTIAYNRLWDDGDAGMGINTSAHISHQTIVGNIVRGTWTYDGITANQGFCSVNGNLDYNTGTGNAYATIAGNTVEGVAQYGISGRSGKYITITGNTIKGTSYAGIYIGGRDSNNIVVTGNLCHTNTYYGIYINDCNDAVVTGNSCLYNAIGIYGISCVGRVTIAGNHLANNSNYGLWLTDSMTTVDLGQNYYYSNTNGNMNDAGATYVSTAIREDQDDLTAYLVTQTVGWTLDVDDDASTDDYQFDDDAANTTEQAIKLTNVLPAYAELVSCQLRCFETVTDSNTMSIDVGTSSGGDEILAAANTDSANDINTTGAGDGPELVATNAARSIYVNATPGANWSTLDAGRWILMITYIDYGQVYTEKNP